ncbi:hypothetical protein GCM10009098_21690 [Rheinheimera aquimaris]|uniref:Uncharacterized protein n=1 Tax=Rheinheimera aquimaris TaxID=412437 RepID=A0ABN1DVX6_9GAMM|nr:hypothetical protein [Rheinheimera aquimaris]MCB5213927.1 hypothetical protein [Rheinheimera aquimaris]
MIPAIVAALAQHGCSITLQPPLTLKLFGTAVPLALLQQAELEQPNILNWLIYTDTTDIVPSLLQGLGATYEDIRFVCQQLEQHNRYQQLQLLAQYRAVWQQAAAIIAVEHQKAGAGIKAANTWLRTLRT